jgi:hypothetical protein
MRVKTESKNYFEDNIKNNPMKLLKAVRLHSLKYQEHQYEISIILDALRTLIHLR